MSYYLARDGGRSEEGFLLFRVKKLLQVSKKIPNKTKSNFWKGIITLC